MGIKQDLLNARDAVSTALHNTNTELAGYGVEPVSTLAELPDKLAEVHAAGQQAQSDAFWDAYQENGDRVHYVYGFAGRGWTNDNFNPKYPMKCNTGAYMFSGTSLLRLDTDKLDMSAATNFGYMFYGGMATCFLQYICALDMSSAKQAQYMFHSCNDLREIEHLTLPSSPAQLTNMENMFYKCTNLEEVRFSGVIPLSISFQWSTKLTHDSLMSIINALNDYSADTSGTTYTLTIGSTNCAKLTAEEIKMAQNKGWDVV